MNIALSSLGLIALSAICGLLSRYIRFIPLPLLQVLMGMGLGLTGIYELQMSLEPELFLLLFVPPLLFADGWRLPKREAFQLRTQILLHAFILVLVNVLLIGYFLHWLRPDIPLWAAFALGSVLSPTDAIAVSAIANRVHIPRALLHILRGEALLNDASGLVALKFSLLASVGAFSFFTATTNVVVVSIAGAIIGMVMAYLYGRIRTTLSEVDGSTTVPLILLLVLLPFGAYVVAEALHASGIIAAVAAGITMSYADPKHDDNAALRLQTGNFFGLFGYVMNGIIFLLLGLQLPRVITDGVSAAESHGQTSMDLLVLVLSVTAVVLGIRFFWGWGEAAVAYRSHQMTTVSGSSQPMPMPNFKVLLAHTVAGIRGAVTLAAAISLPLQVAKNTPFPARDELILIAAGVIVLTLLIATIFLPYLLNDIPADEEKALEKERAKAMVKTSQAAIDALSNEASLKRDHQITSANSNDPDSVLDKLTTEYRQRMDAEKPGHEKSGAEEGHHHELTKQARRVAVRAEREELHRLHTSGEINEETLRALIEPLDLAEEALRPKGVTPENR